MIDLPLGHRLIELSDVTSTNAVLLERAAKGEASGLWMTARSQGAGRGRSGRAWGSPPGNLYASFLLRPGCAPAQAPQLALLAPVALHDAVRALLAAAEERPNIRLKWPNDLLVEGAKVSGILIESTFTPAEPQGGPPSLAVVMGFGLNLASHPAGLDQSATHLAAHNCRAEPAQALRALAVGLQHWLDIWADGAGFADIRRAWLDRAGPIGEVLGVRTGPRADAPRVFGRFAGLDASGALLLDHDGGARSVHVQGDVALGPEDR